MYLIILLTVYPPVELTCCIIPYLPRDWQFTAEIVIIWVFYIGALSIIWKLIGGYHGR